MVSLPGVTFSRKEGAMLEQLREDLRVVREAELQLPALVASVAKGDKASCLAVRDRIFDLEAKAGEAKRDLSERIARGAFFGGVREDMLSLLDKIWKIADNAKDAARLITLAEVTEGNAQAILESEDMRGFLATLDLAVVALQELVGGLEVDKKTALGRVRPVEEREEAADVFKQKVLSALFDRSRRIDPVTVIMVRDFVFSADDVADYAERASDVVTVLVAKGYG